MVRNDDSRQISIVSSKIEGDFSPWKSDPAGDGVIWGRRDDWESTWSLLSKAMKTTSGAEKIR